MGKNSYLGGSTIVGPGTAYFRTSREDGDVARIVDDSPRVQMDEGDQLRAKGIDPIAHAKAQNKRAKIKRSRPKGEIKSLKQELEKLKATRNAS
jgi:hypothetical protein